MAVDTTTGQTYEWGPLTVGARTATPGGTFTTTTTSTGGTWSGAVAFEPDMTDWPADDIIDHYAKELAQRNPA